MEKKKIEVEKKVAVKQERKVILHYHLFKNAGTSLDAAFKENFKGDEWVTKEFPAQPAKNREQVVEWILDNPQAKCFSSHTAILPPPKLKGIKVLPVIFIRHPIDRIASAYAFEIKQGGDNFGAVLARNTTMAGYIETRLALPNDFQCRNFQMLRLSTMFGEKQGDEFTRAKMAVEKLPFIGVVEEFEQSLVKLEGWLKSEGFEDLSIKAVEKNVSRNIKLTLDVKILEIEKELGGNVYQKLLEENGKDLAIYDEIMRNKIRR